MAEILSIADAVVTALNAEAFQGTLEEEFTAERKYLPRVELKDMGTLHVTVVPKAVITEVSSRSTADYQYQIDVGVQKRFAAGDDEADELDPLLGLVEQIADYLRLKRLDEFTDAMWIKTEHPALYAPEHMEQFHQFTSILTFTFRLVR
jgi:hypothetical protein